MSKPIYEYLAEREGQTWTAEDSAYVRDKFRQVETLAEAVIEKRTAELRAGAERLKQSHDRIQANFVGGRYSRTNAGKVTTR